MHWRSSRGFVGGGLVLVVIVIAGLAAPWLAPHSPTAQVDRVGGRLLPPLSARWAIELDESWLLAEEIERTDAGLEIIRRGRRQVVPADTIRNWTADGVVERRFYVLGTDTLSRDVFSRLLFGTRITLIVAFLSILLGMTIGIAVGALAALGGRWLDAILMRIVDGLLAFPWLFLLIALAGILPRDRVLTLVLIIGGSTWMGVSRLTRAELKSLGQHEFVLAARSMGASPLRIFFRHLLPNAITPLLVYATLGVAGVIVVEASLSFLGLGIPPPNPSWGGMINEGRPVLFVAWWLSTFPALALIVTLIGLALIGDGLRDVLDPRFRAANR